MNSTTRCWADSAQRQSSARAGIILFNAIKGVSNAILTGLLYLPITKALKAAGFMEKTEQSAVKEDEETKKEEKE